VAVDACGDVYVADTDNQRVVRQTPTAGGGYTQTVIDDSGLNGPQGVAVDGSGDV
jgi:serine/threonine-protein kinase